MSGYTRDEIVLAPPTISLTDVVNALRKTHVHAAAQNMHRLDEGLLHRRDLPTMLTHVGVSHVILGQLNASTSTRPMRP